MVLHEQDMHKWPDAIYDTSTTNTSFLKYARTLRLMGVKNYRWCLVLLNPELRGVNPFDPTLDAVTRLNIWQECHDNPIYLLREVARVKGGPYIANRGNMALMWLFLNHIDLFLIQPRQTGKSVGVDFLMIWLLYFKLYDTTVQMITKDSSLRTDNITRIKGFIEEMPSYLFVHSKGDPDNQDSLGYETRKTHYRAKVPRGSINDADKVGRGATSEIIQFDEPPYQSHIQTIMTAALGATTDARERAKRNGTPYGILYTTTAGKIDSRDGGYVYKVLQDAAPWTEHYYDAGDQKTLEAIICNRIASPAPLVNITLSHRQLGKTDEWLWETMARNKAFGEAADRDYLNRWTNGTASNPINAKMLAKVNGSLMEPLHVETTPDLYSINWYIPQNEIASYMANNHTIIGNDTSDAIGRDGIDMVITDIKTMMPIATGTYNSTSIPRWTAFFGNLMVRFPKAIWIPERKSSAQAIIDGVVEILDAAGINPYERIYNRFVQEKEQFSDEYQRTRNPRSRSVLYESHKNAFGFNTTGKSRDLLYVQVLNTILDDAATGIKDAKIIGEMSGLVVKNGRIDHAAGSHDDAVVSYLLTGFFLTYGKHLEEYGIDWKDVRSSVQNNREEVRTVAEQMQDQRNNQTRARIEELIETIKNETSEYALIRAEQEIRYLTSTIKGGEFTAETVQELLENVKKSRSNGMRNASMSQNMGYSPNRTNAYL